MFDSSMRRMARNYGRNQTVMMIVSLTISIYGANSYHGEGHSVQAMFRALVTALFAAFFMTLSMYVSGKIQLLMNRPRRR